jgi:hypothetical protein
MSLRRESFLDVVLKNTPSEIQASTTSSAMTPPFAHSGSTSAETIKTVEATEEKPVVSCTDVVYAEMPSPQPFISFDIEYDRLLKSDDDDKSSEPEPKITCIAAVTCEGLFTFWHGGYHETSGSFKSNMSESQIRHFIDFLWTYAQKGYVIVTWGGTAFDFKILYNEVSDPTYKALVHFLARKHVDIPLASAASSGMMMGLSAVAKGMGLGSKPYESASMPHLWAESSSQEAVFRQVWADAALTMRVYQHIFVNGESTAHALGRYRPYLDWITLGGKLRRFYAPYVPVTHTTLRLWNVEECMVAPKPITPFQPSPNMTVESCTRWMLEV